MPSPAPGALAGIALDPDPGAGGRLGRRQDQPRRGPAAPRPARIGAPAAWSAAAPSATTTRSNAAWSIRCNASVMHLQHAGTRIHLIDTPGGPDFLGQSLPALEAVETAAIVINAAAGIEPMARAHDGLGRGAPPRPPDHRQQDRRRRASTCRRCWRRSRPPSARECLPLNLPDATAPAQVVDCFFNRDGHSDFGSVDAAHRALVEQVVEVDGDFVDRYLNDGDVDAARTARAAGAGAARRPPDPGVFRLGAQRRRRGRAAGHHRASCCPTRPRPTRPTSCAAKAPRPCPCTPCPTPRCTCWPMSSR